MDQKSVQSVVLNPEENEASNALASYLQSDPNLIQPAKGAPTNTMSLEVPEPSALINDCLAKYSSDARELGLRDEARRDRCQHREAAGAAGALVRLWLVRHYARRSV